MARFDPNKHHRRSIRLRDFDYSTAGAFFVTICTHGRICLFDDIADGDTQLPHAGQMIRTVWEEIPEHYPGVEIDAFVVMPNHLHGIVVLVGAAPRGRPDSRVSNATDSGHPSPTELGQPRGVAPTRSLTGVVHPIRTESPKPVVGAATHGRPETKVPFSADADAIRTDATGSGHPSPTELGQPRGVAPTMSLADVVHRFKTLTTTRYIEGVKRLSWPPFEGRLWQRNYYEHIIRDDASLERHRRYVEENPARWAEDVENPARVAS